MERQRIKWLDFAKGLTISFVVFAHVISSTQKTLGINNFTLELINFIVFTFVMPCFFAISGYLYKPTNTRYKYKIMLYKKVISLGIPYIIFCIIYVSMQQIGKSAGSGKSTIHIIYPWSSLLKMFAYPISYMWFLYALLLIFLIIGIMDLLHFNEWIKTSFSILFLLIIPLIQIWPAFSNALQYIICFQIGYLIKLLINKHSDKINDLIHKLSLVYGTLILWVILLIIQVHFVGLNYGTDMMTYQDSVTKLLSIVTFFMIFINFNHDWLFRYFDKYGKLTLVIYLVHVPIDSVVRKILMKCGISNSFVLMTLLVVIVWYVSLYVCYLCHKFNVINCVFYPRRYIDTSVMKTKCGRKLLDR